jgi:hypothetical protein
MREAVNRVHLVHEHFSEKWGQAKNSPFCMKFKGNNKQLGIYNYISFCCTDLIDDCSLVTKKMRKKWKYVTRKWSYQAHGEDDMNQTKTTGLISKYRGV